MNIPKYHNDLNVIPITPIHNSLKTSKHNQLSQTDPLLRSPNRQKKNRPIDPGTKSSPKTKSPKNPNPKSPNFYQRNNSKDKSTKLAFKRATETEI